MTLLAQIKAKVAPAILATRDAQVIADAFNVGRVRLQEMKGGIGTILNTLEPDAGGVFLNSLEAMAPTVPAVKWGLKMIEASTFDFALPASRAMIDSLVLPPGNAALKAVAEVPDPVSEFEVRCALWSDSGEYMA